MRNIEIISSTIRRLAGYNFTNEESAELIQAVKDRTRPTPRTYTVKGKPLPPMLEHAGADFGICFTNDVLDDAKNRAFANMLYSVFYQRAFEVAVGTRTNEALDAFQSLDFKPNGLGQRKDV